MSIYLTCSYDIHINDFFFCKYPNETPNSCFLKSIDLKLCKISLKSYFLGLDRRVLPTVTPGYLRPLIPENAPEKPDNWTDVMADIERVIMPGVTHWHSPKVVKLAT